MKKIWAATQPVLRIRTSHTWWEEDNDGRTTVLEARDASQTGCWLPHQEDSATRWLSISLFCCFWLFSAPPGFFLLNGFREFFSLYLVFCKSCAHSERIWLLDNPYQIKGIFHWPEPRASHPGYRCTYCESLNQLCLCQCEYIIQTWWPGIRNASCFLV